MPAIALTVLALGVVSWAILTVAPALSVPENVFVDFRINVWEPGRLILDGKSTLLAETPEGEIGTVYPPIAVVLTLPFAVLPYGIAALLWLATLVGCVVWAMRLCGVRDRRCLALALASPPVVAGLAYGNLSLVLVLALAGVWVWRDDELRAGGVLGLAIASKLFLFPLLLWLLFTRRSRGAAFAAFVTVVASLGGWAAVGFRGLQDFPALTRRNAAEFLDQGVSLSSIAANLGTSTGVAATLAAFAAAGALALAWHFKQDDLAGFTWTVAAALLFSPIVWGHYYALLLVPLAVSAPTLSRAWVLPYLTIPQLTAAPPGGAKIVDAVSCVGFMVLTARHCSAPPEARAPRQHQAQGRSRAVGDLPI